MSLSLFVCLCNFADGDAVAVALLVLLITNYYSQLIFGLNTQYFMALNSYSTLSEHAILI